jgi:hypothetical protein
MVGGSVIGRDTSDGQRPGHADGALLIYGAAPTFKPDQAEIRLARASLW